MSGNEGIGFQSLDSFENKSNEFANELSKSTLLDVKSEKSGTGADTLVSPGFTSVGWGAVIRFGVVWGGRTGTISVVSAVKPSPLRSRKKKKRNFREMDRNISIRRAKDAPGFAACIRHCIIGVHAIHNSSDYTPDFERVKKTI